MRYLSQLPKHSPINGDAKKARLQNLHNRGTGVRLQRERLTEQPVLLQPRHVNA